MDLNSLSPILPGPLVAESEFGGNSADARSAASADFDSFLTLLTAQLRNQDPLAPLDSTEFIAQLASFSSVEQIVGTNERLDSLMQQSIGADLGSFANWIGNKASMSDGTFRATGESIGFNVPTVAEADAIRADVRDSAGSLVATLNLSPADGNTATWDGTSANGASVADQDLKIELSYFTRGELVKEQTAEVPRMISGIRGSSAGLELDFEDGGSAKPEDVVRLAL